jgi:hypothetical protein
VSIERFTGYPVPLGGLTSLPAGYYGLPGGGYRGLTDELDALVQEAAEKLTAEYGRDVVIRFNSNRESGGAYLKDAPTKDCLVGINGGLYRPSWAELGMTMDDYLDRHRDDRAWYEALPQTLGVHTNVNVAALIDPSLATDGRYHRDPSEDSPYSYVKHESVDAALVWLRQKVRVPR